MRSSLRLLVPHLQGHGTFRAYATETAANVGARQRKREGSVEEFYSAFKNQPPPLPQRFSDLKKEIFSEKLVESWREVLGELALKTEEVDSQAQDSVPQVEYSSIVNGLSKTEIERIKYAGCLIVRGAIPKEEALGWKQSVQEYVAKNSEKVKGIPPDNIVFYEIYNAKAQILARTHPGLLNTQRALLSLWGVSNPNSPISLSTPITYFDRFRIRPPGPSVFTLGPHIDGGSLERWEDTGFRQCWNKILQGKWREHDPFDVTPRITAKQDLYHVPNSCTVFRPWQGWTSLSTTGPREGSLKLLPLLSLTTAYIILRPFFRLRTDRRLSSNGQIPLGFNDWEVNLESTDFPSCEPGKALFPTEISHPHLRLGKTVVSIPKVEPGDQVYWHCDLVHAVESEHIGKGDSSVFYTPAVALTAQNATYLRDQLANFRRGLPAPDFPTGEGEASFKGRGTEDDVQSLEARRVFGIEPYDIPANATPGAAETIKLANAILSAR